MRFPYGFVIILSFLWFGITPLELHSQAPDEAQWQETTNSIASAAIHSLETYHWSKLEDVYKLVHQATLGTGHQNVSWQDMVAYLRSEWAEVEQTENPHISDPVIEDLGGVFVRVNMVPYMHQGGEEDSLAMALYRSLTVPPDTALLVAAWAETCDLMLAGDPTLLDQINTFTNLMQRDGWPAVHHSQQYTLEYSPHYRVISRVAADSLLAGMGQARDGAK